MVVAVQGQMKVWKGRKRLAKKLNSCYFNDYGYRETLEYLMRCAPGDLIHACTGYNHRIQSISFRFLSSRGGSTRIINEVEIVDDTGRFHYFPGKDCVTLPWSAEEVVNYVSQWDCEAGHRIIERWSLTELAEDIALLRKGQPIVDAFGVRLK